jgi:hypothetical protein
MIRLPAMAWSIDLLRRMKDRRNKIFLFTILFLLFSSSVWATQEHADPEGLYSHQIAHLFFMFAMVVLIIQIKRTSPLSEGWRYIGIAAFLFLLWNIDVFTVHRIREQITPELFSGSAQMWTQEIELPTLKTKMFYAGKILDHLLLVGAMVVFIFGIKSFSKDIGREER